jgi:hypothetical protein
VYAYAPYTRRPLRRHLHLDHRLRPNPKKSNRPTLSTAPAALRCPMTVRGNCSRRAGPARSPPAAAARRRQVLKGSLRPACRLRPTVHQRASLIRSKRCKIRRPPSWAIFFVWGSDGGVNRQPRPRTKSRLNRRRIVRGPFVFLFLKPNRLLWIAGHFGGDYGGAAVSVWGISLAIGRTLFFHGPNPSWYDISAQRTWMAAIATAAT